MNGNDSMISVIIPTYNRVRFITKTIESVLNQSFGDFEVIIVDDGSTDDTEVVIKAFHDPRIFYFKKDNNERGAARNYGIAKARGAYVTFLDSDDVLKKNHLETASNFIREHQNPVIFHVGYDVVDEYGKVISVWKPLPSPVNTKLIEGNYLSCLGIYVKKEIISEINFNEERTLAGSEDYELWMRLAARFDILTCSLSTAYLVNHSQRSVVITSSSALINRIESLKESLSKDQTFNQRFGARLKEFYAYLDLYTALHLIMEGNKTLGIRHWRDALSAFPHLVFKRRFWTIAKKIILK